MTVALQGSAQSQKPQGTWRLFDMGFFNSNIFGSALCLFYAEGFDGVIKFSRRTSLRGVCYTRHRE
jgi:hypothetical protein